MRELKPLRCNFLPQPPLLEREPLLRASAPSPPSSLSIASRAMNSETMISSSSTSLFSSCENNSNTSNIVTFRNGLLTSSNGSSNSSMLQGKQTTESSENETLATTRKVRESVPPRTLKLASSWSLPHLCMKTNFATRRSMFNSPTTNWIEKPESDFENAKISHIVDCLYVGSRNDAFNPEILKKNNIKRVLNVSDCGKCSPSISNDPKHFMHIPMFDSNEAQLFPHFEKTYRFIESAHEAKENILVHCTAGISRSPTLAIAYLMRGRRINYEKALKLIKSKRPIVSPNINFMGQLVLYENGLRETKILPKSDENEPYTTHVPTPKDDVEKNKRNNVPSSYASTSEKMEKPLFERPIQRPTCFSGLSMRSDKTAMNKSLSSDFTARALQSQVTTSFSSSSSSYSISRHSTHDELLSLTTSTITKIVNDNGKRTMETSHIKEHDQSSNNDLFSVPLSATPTPLDSGDSKVKNDFLNVILPEPINDKIISPSTHFSKLDISLSNPCFTLKDGSNEQKYGGTGRRVSTSTDVSESASSGIFTDTSCGDRDDEHVLDDDDQMEVQQSTPHIQVSNISNPMFELMNNNAPCRLRSNISNKNEKSGINSKENSMHNILLNNSESKLSVSAEKSGKTEICKMENCRNIIRKSRLLPSFGENDLKSRGSKFYCCQNNAKCGRCCDLVYSLISHRRTGPFYSKSPRNMLPTLNDDSDLEADDTYESASESRQQWSSANMDETACQPDDNNSIVADNGFSERSDSIISDEKASQCNNIIIRYITRKLGLDKSNTDNFNEHNKNEDEFLSPCNTDEYSEKESNISAYQTKRRRVSDSRNEEKERGDQISLESTSTSVFSKYTSEKTGIYSKLHADKKVEENRGFEKDYMNIQRSSSVSLYPKLPMSIDSETFQLVTIEPANTLSSIPTMAATSTRITQLQNHSKSRITTSLSVNDINGATVSENTPNTDANFDAARCDPERASIDSTSSLEIFVK